MPTDQCFEPEELAEIVPLPPTDPRRQHVEECPRCRTLARRYRDFLDPTPLPPEADAEAAGRMLRQRLTTALPELAPAMDTVERPAGRPPSSRVTIGTPHRQRSWRPLIAVAAVLVFCLGLLGVRNQLTQPAADRPFERSVLRGEDLGPGLLDATVTSTGLRLAWQQPAETDASEAVFLDASLAEIARLSTDTDGVHEFPLVPDGARYARIEFFAGGDMVASTRTVPLPTRP